MILNIIIGKNSNLSECLHNKLDNSFLVSTLDVSNQLNKIDFYKYTKINFIFNQFQTAINLNTLENPTEYIYRSIASTANVLTFIKEKSLAVNKIIYTSSSSVYGNNTSCNEEDLLSPLNLHASLKAANEHLIKQYCLENNTDYTITRIFNMYGGNDNFSIISKLIQSYHTKDVLTLINRGESIRDFIHIDDVVHIYLEILKMKKINILNIGTGDGKSILYLIDILRNHNILIETKSAVKKELQISVCNNRLLLTILPNYFFKKVEDYILEQIGLKK